MLVVNIVVVVSVSVAFKRHQSSGN